MPKFPAALVEKELIDIELTTAVFLGYAEAILYAFYSGNISVISDSISISEIDTSYSFKFRDEIYGCRALVG